ncbi:MAG: glycosyltransferase family 92 protein [Gammaproteobacteria bacterium]|nr:glycosyltransferase family 92 protein [Gammaproteobacteria bacterium]
MNKDDRKYFLVFVTNFKNENPYLREWLEYHLLVGIDHFYLYDQDGSDVAKSILGPYEDSGLITRHQWTKYDGTKYDGPTRFYQTNKNHLAFTHCAQHYGNQACWMMKIDVDEFLYPCGGDHSLVPRLKSLDRNEIKGIRIPRFNFGNNGHLTRPDKLVMESYTRREATASNYKEMANSKFLSNNKFCNSAHRWHYKLFRPGRFIRAEDVNGLRINHYYTKSLEEYQMRQNVSRGRGRDKARFLERNQGCNAVDDTGMLRFVPEIKQALLNQRRNQTLSVNME